MLCREIIPACSETRTKHANALFGHDAEFLGVKVVKTKRVRDVVKEEKKGKNKGVVIDRFICVWERTTLRWKAPRLRSLAVLVGIVRKGK
jgi:hypothetical protein